MRTGWLTMLLLAGCAAPSHRYLAPARNDAVPTPAKATSSAAPAIDRASEAVAPGIIVIRGRFVSGAQPDGNSVILHGPRGAIVVDTGRHDDHAQRVLAALRSGAGEPVAIVNTHWHLDHVGGNRALRQAYPRVAVLASDAIDGALTGFLAHYRAQLASMVRAPGASTPDQVAAWQAEIDRIDAGAALLPDRRLVQSEDLALAGRAVRLGVERDAVSGGDVWLLDRTTRTLVAGDLVTLPVPLFDTACAPGWRAALARLDALDFERLVPGHGAPMGRAEFKRYRHAFDRLLDCAAGTSPAEACKAQWLDDAGSLIPQADAALAGGLLDYYISQVLRAPPPRRDRYCRQEAKR